MTIEDYRIEFLDQLRSQAEVEGTDPGSQFLNKALEDLEEIGELIDPIPMSIEIRGRRGRLMCFDAYGYDEADGALILIASEFNNERDNVANLTNSRIDEICQRMLNFVEESVCGDICSYCDDSDPAIELAKEFRVKIGKRMLNTEILRFKLYILSNCTLSTHVKNVSRASFLDRPVELNIWTLERFFQSYVSNNSETIEIRTTDFGLEGIQCLKADLGNAVDYDAYLCIVPGRFLADLYLKYGSRLLQGNVRAFLGLKSSKGPNRGIRATIMNAPENFFTYNNGIAIVARSIQFSPDGTRIVLFKDFQIINGGQTTASLANAIIKKEDKKGMDNLFVPMKLTVLNVEDDMSEDEEERYNIITQTISECANCQNPVTAADFFSNHPFHVEMEKLSRKIMAPPVGGSPFHTFWFYERSRGKWEQEQFKMTQAERAKFANIHPKSQVIRKEKLAKCLNTIYLNPHEVCESLALNFKHFAPIIEKMYDESPEKINEEFFKKAICSVILFDGLDRIVNKAEWYPKGGDKAQIVPYTIAKLISLIPKDKDLDWKSIWIRQTLPQELSEELYNIAYATQTYLTHMAQGGLVRSLARKQGTWSQFKSLPYELSDRFKSTLISIQETKADEASAKRQHRFDAGVDASVSIFNRGYTYWMQVYNELNKDQVVSFGDIDFIKSIASYIERSSLPSASQSKRLLKIIRKAEERGYIMPE